MTQPGTPAPISSLPDFARREKAGELSIRPPGVFTGGGTMIYTASGKTASIQSFAESYFDAPTGGEVTAHALGPIVMFVFFNVDRLSSPAEPQGWTPNHEFSLTVPLVLKFKNQPLKARLGLWAPYVIIDNARGMVTGRESWGWFKGYGSVDSPRNPAADGTASRVSTMIFETFSPDTRGTVSDLVTVKPKPGGREPALETIAHAVDETGHLCREFIDLIAQGVEDLAVFGDLVRHWRRHEIPAFNLKQFRDTRDSSKACYQAITTSPLKINRIHGMSRVTGDLEIGITPCESHEIVPQLGLPGNRIDAGLSLFTEIDYEADDGEVLWQA